MPSDSSCVTSDFKRIKTAAKINKRTKKHFQPDIRDESRLTLIPNLFLDGPYVTVAQCFHHVGSRFAELTIRGIKGLREECCGPLISLLLECFSTHDKISSVDVALSFLPLEMELECS